MFVYLPVEIKNRDFYPRLLLAKHLIKFGHKVIIGRKKEIEIYALKGPRGVYYTLQSTRNYLNFYKKLKLYGHKIALSDEEGLVTYSDKIFLNTRATNDLLSLADIIFVWGKNQFNIFKKNKKKFLKKVCVAGNPRFDFNHELLNKFFLKNTEIKYNNYILINSSFAIANHYDENVNSVAFRKKIGLINNKLEKDGYLFLKKYNKKKLKIYIDLANYLVNKIKNIKVVYKVHPSESVSIYNKLLDKKIILLKNANISESILKAKFVIHDYCTTSLETLLYKKIPISFKINRNNTYLKNIPYLFSNSFESKIKVLNFININKKKKLDKKKVNFYINNFTAKDSCQIISKKISKFNIDDSYSFYNFLIFKIYIKLYQIKFFFFNNEYINTKTKNISNYDILNFYKYLKVKNFKIKKIINNLFILSK